jgi:hypothetical protein
MEWLKQIAPSLATALLGPLGGAAVSAIGSALGMSDADKAKVEAVLKNGQISGDQLAAIQQAEIAFKAKMADLGVDLEKIAAADRDSARHMQIETKSFVPAALALVVVLAWVAIQWYLLSHVVDSSMRELVARVLGTLDAALTLVLSFYFGSSRSSQAKDETISKLSGT